MIWSFLVSLAWAERPIPDYRESLQEAAAAELAQLFQERGMDATVAAARHWESELGQDPRVAYELGLAYRLAGQEDQAMTELNRALTLDPNHLAALYDRGEIRLNRGDLVGAEQDFRRVLEIKPDAWVGHFRLADIAGRRKDPVLFKAELVEALRNGFSFRMVVGDPRWHGYLKDPVLGPELRTLLMVYQDASVLDALEGPTGE